MHRQFHWHAVPLVVLLAAAPVQRAGAQSVSFGVMAGGSLSTFTGDFVADAKQYAGFIVGGFVHLGAAGFAVQPGLYYTMKGAKSSDFTETTGDKATLNYIQVPIVIRLHMGSLYVGAGPAIGFKLGCKLTVNSGTAGTATDCPTATSGSTAKSTELSGIAEAGIEFGKFSLGARADLGLSNVIIGPNGSSSNLDVKTRTISAVAAIRF